MDNILSKDIAYRSLTDFFSNNKPFVLFGTGTSCAVDTDFGMDALKKCLLEEVPKHNLCSEQQAQWESVVKALAVSNDLESAMNAVVNDELTQVIVSTFAVAKINITY
jgi:predicted AlkP superfamily phosphohydrolase/phosphomutase